MALFESASLVVTPNGVKESKLYSVKPTDGSGDLTVTRATTATRVNAEGLIEAVPYNLLQNSQVFNIAYWSKGLSTVIDNNTTSPSGASNAAKLTEAAGTGSHHIHEATGSFTPVVSSLYTMSCFVKLPTTGAGRFVQLPFFSVGFGNNAYVNFDLLNGVVGTVGSSITYYSITPLLNGWYRISASALANATGASGFQLSLITSATSARTESYNVTAGSEKSVLLYGSQIQQGALKDYILTTNRLNVPRLDYTNSTCPSILIEPQRTNLLLRSEEFDNVSWSKPSSTVTSNAIVSPDGTLDADKLVENTENNQHRLDQTTTSVIGTNTFSVFAKKGERDYIWLRVGTSGAFFNLTNGTIENATGVTASIENFKNGWYRCIITRTSTVANEIVRINLSIGTTNTYLGNGTSGVYIWGAQLEAGAYATSYIPTTTASVTRNADVISKTGISSLIGQTQGTVYVEINNTLQTYLSANLIKLSSDSNNEIFIRKEGSSNTYTARFRANSINVYTNAGINVLNGNNKIAFAYKSGYLSVYLNGVQIGTSVATGSFSQLVGNLDIDSSFNDRIKSVSLWKTRLTNAELAALTTL